MKIRSTRLYFSPISINDIESVHELHSMPQVDEYNTLGIPESIEDTIAVLKPNLEYSERAKAWGVRHSDSDEFIGMVGLTLSGDRFKVGEVYYKFAPQYWGQGYASEATKVLVSVGFSHYNLHRITAGVAVENVASISVLEKCGFTREGRGRAILPIRGQWVDNYMYAIVEGDSISPIEFDIE